MLVYDAGERSCALMNKDMTDEITAVYDMGVEELQEKFEELYGFLPG